MIILLFAPFTASCLRADVKLEGEGTWPSLAIKMSAALEVRAAGEAVDSVGFDVKLPWAR